MQETKTPRDPKKSLWASYAIIFVVVLLFNALLLPSFAAWACSRWITAPFCRCWKAAS